MTRKIFILIICLISNSSLSNQNIVIAGSSTIYPFITLSAEKFSKKFNESSVIVENVGTGHGIKLFCTDKIDIAAASRKVKSEEVKLCQKNNIEIEEKNIGYDAIILANSNSSVKLNLTSQDIFLSISKFIPRNGKMILNDFKNWNEINDKLPSEKIEIYGPSYNSGTRDILVEILLKNYCENNNEIQAIVPKVICNEVREDGAYIEISENYNLIISKILINPKSIGIFGYNFLNNNLHQIQAVSIDKTLPTLDNIITKKYKLVRPLFLYLNKNKMNDYLKDFIKETMSNDAIGQNGYLTKTGLINNSNKNDHEKSQIYYLN